LGILPFPFQGAVWWFAPDRVEKKTRLMPSSQGRIVVKFI